MQIDSEMSVIGDLSFFLGLQITQSLQGVFIYQSKYLKETLKKIGMEDYKIVNTSAKYHGRSMSCGNISSLSMRNS